ncbi:hypothetical protein SCA03_49630 [Streptomyces cacaoi]|uniref:Uncharacterized protein n=1 Tax=Streptomyces cacaoi TaxID=1898 RepID=A0A4Y3R4D5_STRCI|nr:hypothetical protein SCA03_49630 [Streptomyces cacaoi]
MRQDPGVQTRLLQPGPQRARRTELLMAQFGMHMEVTTEGGQFSPERLGQPAGQFGKDSGGPACARLRYTVCGHLRCGWCRGQEFVHGPKSRHT